VTTRFHNSSVLDDGIDEVAGKRTSGKTIKKKEIDLEKFSHEISGSRKKNK